MKIGYYKPKNTGKPTPRYKCKLCGKSFSTHTDKPQVGQHNTSMNEELFKLLVSGVSLRRASELLDVAYNTVLARFDYLAEQCRVKHKEHLKTIQTTFVQVDEMETYLHARAKPLSVPLVVRVKTGEILGFSVAKMPAKGLLAQIGKKNLVNNKSHTRIRKSYMALYCLEQ